MDKRNKRKRIKWIAALFLLLLLTAAVGSFVQPQGNTVLAAESPQAESETETTSEKQLVITVVEDIPAMDIEENEVPLAAFPDTAGRSGTRHAVLMGLVLACVLAYVIYMGRYEKKLAVLRHKAARAEYDMLKAAREEKERSSKHKNREPEQ